jgi:hypothetical protein
MQLEVRMSWNARFFGLSPTSGASLSSNDDPSGWKGFASATRPSATEHPAQDAGTPPPS